MKTGKLLHQICLLIYNQKKLQNFQEKNILELAFHVINNIKAIKKYYFFKKPRRSQFFLFFVSKM